MAARSGPSDSPHGLHALGRDLVEDADLARPTVRVLVLAQVLLGQRVDVRVGPGLGDVGDPAPELHVAIRIIRVDDGERHGRVAPEVLVLEPAFGGDEANVGAIVVEPDRRHLRRAVGVDRGQGGEGFLLQEVLVLVGKCGHHASPFLIASITAKAWRTDLIASVPPMRAPMSSVSAISASGAPRWRISSTRCSIQSKQFCDTATASAVSSLCFLLSAPSAYTCLPSSANAPGTFMALLATSPFSRFRSAFFSRKCIISSP